MGQPKSLEELSSTAMAVHITNVCVSLLGSIEAHTQNVTLSAHTELTSICEALKSAVTSKIPPRMSDSLTNLWLTYLDWSFRTSKLKFTKESDEVLVHMIRGIIHPKVTHLDCTSAKIQTMVCRNLDVMERLERLEVSGLDRTSQQYLMDNISSLKHLVSLHIHFICTNEMLLLIGDSCPNIAYLDIFGSEKVDDESVPAILTLSHLTALNIFGTSISTQCSGNLIQATKDKGNSLTKFGCSSVQAQTLELLLQHKHSLTYLQLATDLNDLFALTSFTHLKAILIHCISFSSLQSMLSTLGHNLVHLELHGVSRVDVRYVGTCCQQLVRYEMHNCTYSPWTHLQLQPMLPIFTMLKILKIHLMSKYPMLSHMDNLILLMVLEKAHDVRHLSISTYSNVDAGFINLLLAVNPLQKLQEFNLGSTSETLIDPSKLLNLLHNCKNLHRVMVNGIEIVWKPAV